MYPLGFINSYLRTADRADGLVGNLLGLEEINVISKFKLKYHPHRG